MKASLLPLALLPGLLCGQPQAARPEIHGTVLEPGTDQPVVDAEVSISLLPDPPPKFILNGGPKDLVATVHTDINGAFSATLPRFGIVHVRAEKDGFGPATSAPGPGPSSQEASVTLDRGHPRREVRLQLARPAYLVAHVIDEETRRPVAGIKLAPFRVAWMSGARQLLPEFEALTESDAEGKFVSGKLAPGDYVLGVRPDFAEQGLGLIKKTFTHKDAEVVDHDIARTYWPGGRDADASLAVSAGSGATVDIGTVAIRKAPLYRATVSVSSPTCAPGELVMVTRLVRSRLGYTTKSLSDVPCRGEFLLTRIDPGTYWLEAHSINRPVATRERGSVELRVIDRNIEIKIPLARGVDVEGRLTSTEGSAQPDWTAVKFMLMPTGGLRAMDETPKPPDDHGRFEFTNISPREHRFLIGMPDSFYVKDILYNGARLPEGLLDPSAGALAHKLEIVVDDKPATIAGTVKNGDAAAVIAVRWPPELEEFLFTAKTARTAADGSFRLGGLAPGEYRCFAVSPANVHKLDEPGVLDRVLGAAPKLTLSAGEIKTIELELID